MSSRVRALARLVASLVFVLASSWLALADEEPPAQTRATIRGTGNDVSIVYKGVTEKAQKHNAASAKRLSGGPAPAQPDPLGEATRMAEHGADDQSLIHYFQTHQNELPDVVDNDAVRRLRKAGAGTGVVTYLSHVSAVDIGETAEGPSPQYAYANPGEMDPGYAGEYPSADMGYPFYGSYGGYGSSGNFRHGRRFVGKNGPGFGFGNSRPAFPAHPIVSPRPMTSMGGMHGGGAHVGTFARRP